MGQTAETHSAFRDDEYCIYDPTRQRIAYLVEFSLSSDGPVAASAAVAPVPRGVGQYVGQTEYFRDDNEAL